METDKSGIDYLSLQELLFRELKTKRNEGNEIPQVTLEKGETRVQFTIPSLNNENLLGCIQLIKSHIENLRIHTFEPGFYSFQALNENIFETKGLMENVRFRFISSRGQAKVEVSKKGDFKKQEVYALLALYTFFYRDKNENKADPVEILSKLGVTVFEPSKVKSAGERYGFELIGGYEEVKREIKESIILPLESPETYDEVSRLTRKYPGRNRPRAILFEGEPGVGKTTMAKIVSYLSDIPLIYVPIESIMSKYYGESAQNLAYVFDAAALFPSSLIFLDEIDSLAGSREDGMIEATRKILSVLLRKLDGFEQKGKTITIGATNRKQDLDHALLSRFDKTIYFPLPNEEEIISILENYSIHLSHEDRKGIASGLMGMSGRNIKDFCDHIERKWASEIIEKKLDLSPPPFSVYFETINILKRRN